MNPWTLVNLKLIAKSISELHYEEVLKLESEKEGSYQLNLVSGVSYHFQGRVSAWGHVWVYPESITRQDKKDPTAAQFFIDSLEETQMGELTLGNFLEELNATLYSDMEILQKEKSSSEEMSSWDGEKLQTILSGHPKLLLNKGRLGWNGKDLAQYAPEHGQTFQLHWILAHCENLQGSQLKSWDMEALLNTSFFGTEKERFQKLLKTYDLKTFHLLPVHPWQWENVIKLQFQSELHDGRIIDLGVGGDLYRPQVSLRTLSNVSRPKELDIKLPLTILNTSCVRGLPQKYLTMTPALSVALTNIISQDKLLSNAKVEVLAETSAWGYTHPHFHQVKNAPYRYHEHLGAVWRESVQGKLESHEKGILAAALFHQDEKGKTLISAYAQNAGIEIKEWLKLYTQFVIIPLYHLQLKYGVGLVAHGQNVVVRLTHSRPSGVFLKDFHGDLRLSTEHKDIHKDFFGTLTSQLTHLPPEHLIHDLITGHFITVLRFMAGALEESKEMNESDFYKTISKELKTYLEKHPSTEKTNLLAKTFQRVLVNKVRFKIGYGDSSERPIPLLGSLLNNPLHPENLL